MSSAAETVFIETRENRRFQEFCDACRRYRYIGLCYGPPGVGKTLSARQYANWDAVTSYNTYRSSAGTTLHDVLNSDVVFWTASVTNTPGQVDKTLYRLRDQLRHIPLEELYRRRQVRFNDVWANELKASPTTDDVFAHMRNPSATTQQLLEDIEHQYREQQVATRDPTRLIIIDEADRLKMAVLDQLRDIFDRGDIGLVLIGMPGLEKRLARYPQLYSRIGFVHEYRPLSREDIRQLLQDSWCPPGIVLPVGALSDDNGINTIIRVTGGNFRLLHRLLTQIGRVLEINQLETVTPDVVDAARESLVIGTA